MRNVQPEHWSSGERKHSPYPLQPITKLQLLNLTSQYKCEAGCWFLIGTLAVALTLGLVVIVSSIYFTQQPLHYAWLFNSLPGIELVMLLFLMLVGLFSFYQSYRLSRFNDQALSHDGYIELQHLMSNQWYWQPVMLYLAQLIQDQREITNGDLFVLKQQLHHYGQSTLQGELRWK